MLLEPLNAIIGVRADPELTQALRETVNSFPEVRGAYDLTLHNYGPTEIIGSVHIEVPDRMTARELHALTRTISMEVFAEFGIILTVGIYAANDGSPQAAAIQARARALAAEKPEILELHGFYLDTAAKHLSFDLIVAFGADAEAIRREMVETLAKEYPDYAFDVILDTDFSD